jgi:hypothetical protein
MLLRPGRGQTPVLTSGSDPGLRWCDCTALNASPGTPVAATDHRSQHEAPNMHEPHGTPRVPRHVVFMGAFAVVAAATALALHERPDAQRPALNEQAPATAATVDATTSTIQPGVPAMQEIAPNDSRSVVSAENSTTTTPGELVVAEAPQPTTVTHVGTPRHRGHAHRRSYAHASTSPSGSGGARSLASLPPPGD